MCIHKISEILTYVSIKKVTFIFNKNTFKLSNNEHCQINGYHSDRICPIFKCLSLPAIYIIFQNYFDIR